MKPINSHDSSTFAYNQKEALATADAMDKAVANTKARINQIHKNPAAKVAEKQQSIKDLQRVTDIAYKYSNNKWEHKPTWELDRKTGTPVDVTSPNLQAAQKKHLNKLIKHGIEESQDPNAGVKYVSKEERIQHHYDTLDAEKARRRNTKFI